MTAHAEWKYFDSTENDTFYIDYSRINTEGRYKTIWVLDDFKSPDTFAGKQFQSTIQKQVIDCQGSRSHIVALYHYSEQMGNGAVVFSANYQIKESDWKYKPPNTIGEAFIKIACATNNNPKPPVSNTQDIKRQKCISLGLAPDTADFRQCMK